MKTVSARKRERKRESVERERREDMDEGRNYLLKF